MELRNIAYKIKLYKSRTEKDILHQNIIHFIQNSNIYFNRVCFSSADLIKNTIRIFMHH